MTRATAIDALDWTAIARDLEETGVAVTGPLLAEAEARDLVALYPDKDRFRNRVVMERHGYGRGEYKYFAYPLPPPVAALRQAAYPRLAPIADLWNERLRDARRYPATLDGYLAECHAAGQVKPTPLLLKYGPDDFNCLHQDLYGDMVFPFQMVLLLSRPGVDFTGGEFTLVEQRPRVQSRAEVVPLGHLQAAIFAVRHRPARGTRGFHRVNLRHGVSRVRSGERFTAGIIFHDAR
ncbi:2OG-Fe(II) oxygenase [Azospirillum sp. RWY-5-1]|uniref:2OG-Fe(II) oxygenase n=1 Tax=Azospirillum oleiclasticum TaxID=2735135 RepID=A0ABX2TAI2_9PROT|nr:2OG-Fe(II) oxygenase [Azospirillum oleiclasticum]NYZ15294.1 2OG-Fe(II) oxygenase [Azospirillum oleiclasticum]NYZ21285.1 2OG-Fe(II) oxygenase [Azospirillum oleiclasticum]